METSPEYHVGKAAIVNVDERTIPVAFASNLVTGTIARFLILFAMALMLPFAGTTAVGAEISAGDVVVVPLKGEVSKAQFFFLRRILKQAEAAGAAAFILDMDTPGGRLDVAVEMIDLLSRATIPTLTYVNDDAASAGALIALGTKSIWMAPVSAIGAAAPVMGGGGDIPETMNDKIISYYSGYFRAAATRNGYNPDIAQAFIDKDKEVKIGDRVLHEKGKPLTLDPQQAVEMVDGKHVLASGIADSIEDLVSKGGLAGELRRIEPSGFEKVALLITTLAPIFLLGGMLGVYLELKSPGLGIAGVLAAICFLLFFAGHYIAGLTGFEVMAVFVLGAILVLVEIFFFPGVFVFALTGTALMVGSVLFAMTDVFPGENLSFNFETFRQPMVNLTIAIFLAAIFISFLATRIASIPGFRRLVLSTSQVSGGSLPAADAGNNDIAPGTQGVALTILRPSGRAQFGNTVCDVISEGDFLPPGSRLQAVRREGASILVQGLTEDKQS